MSPFDSAALDFFPEAEDTLYDVDTINERLAVCVLDWVIGLRGAPDKRSGYEWRWGSRGSLRVFVAGSRAGSWSDFEADEGGRPFDLILREHDGDEEKTRAFIRGVLGDAKLAPGPEREQRRAQRAEAAAKQRAAEDRTKVLRAQRLVAESVPIVGTLPERYLVKTRKIPKPEAWPECVRFHASTSSLLVVATNDAAEVRMVQRIHLTPKAKKVSAAQAEEQKLPAAKITSGRRDSTTALRLPGPADRPLLLCEGPEDALSIWVATGLETHAALGSMTAYQPADASRPIIVCRDMDNPASPSSIALNRMLAGWVKERRPFFIATPYDAFGGKEQKDFNDLIRSHGTRTIMDRIEIAVMQRPRVRRAAVAAARQTLTETIGAFFEEAQLWDATVRNAVPMVNAIRVDTAAGKSTEARRRAVEFLTSIRAKGDQRAIVFAVPTLKLAREQAAKFAELNSEFTAATWHGRRADDPDTPGETMCQNLEAVSLAEALKADVNLTCCRSREHGTECPFFSTCGYQQQRRKRADVWFVAHEMLFSQKPKTIGKVAALIVDESMWQSGLNGGATLSRSDIVLEDDHEYDIYGGRDSIEIRPPGGWPPNEVPRGFDEPTRRVRSLHRSIPIRREALKLFDQAPEGPITRRAIIASGITEDDASIASAREWDRLIPTDLHPGSSVTERSEARKAAEKNRRIPKLHMMWDAFRILLRSKDIEAASGWAVKAFDENERPIFKLKGRRLIREGWLVPTLIMDATMNIDLLRPYWPHAELVADIKVAAPYQKITQIDDEVFGKRSLMPQSDRIGPFSTDKDKERKHGKKRKLEALRATIHTLARQYAPQRVLVVLQKAIEETIGELPPNVETAHHNDIAGHDEWGSQPGRPGVAALIVVGRTQPGPAAIEALAEALTGLATPKLKGGGKAGWYHPSAVERETADGRRVYGIADWHHDPVTEAIRAQVCDAELLQIIGRARGINRTADNPVDIYVLASTPIQAPIAKVISIADLAPTLADKMLAAGGVAFEKPADAAAAYPDLFPSRRAAEKTFERDGALRQTLYRYSSIGNVVKLAPYDYQLAGPGKRPTRAWLSPAAAVDPAATLARLLGQPVKFARPWPPGRAP